MKTSNKTIGLVAVALLIAGVCAAQFRGGRGFGGGFGGGRGGRGGGSGPIWRLEGGGTVDESVVRTAREVDTHSTGSPDWTNSPSFSKDVFTFCRIIRDSNPEAPFRAGSWTTDYPDSDLNLSFRLQQMTSLKVDPNGRVLRLSNPELFDYPWIYMVEPGSLSLRDNEVPILRKYLLNGGVLMADDFWGEWQWDIFAGQIRRALPERQFVELPMDHPIFQSVFPLKGPKNSL
ncbi:MAG: hypothetical protein JWM04_2231, partial [Verrucomicrobiales bacterium]|nr:hypothetical protein [Verrucomicrobiales bacterium]